MRRSAHIFLVAVSVLSCTVSTFAQEKLWKELTTDFSMLYQQGRYSEAAKLAEEALTVAKKTFGPNHLIVATSQNNLAELYRAQGKYAQAEPVCKRSLKTLEKVLGKNHPHVATVCENMAELYREIGKEDEAKRLEEHARKIRSKR